jgi:hypothetical protein
MSKIVACHICRADPIGRWRKPPQMIFIDGDVYACRDHVSAEKEAEVQKRERERGFVLEVRR